MQRKQCLKAKLAMQDITYDPVRFRPAYKAEERSRKRRPVFDRLVGQMGVWGRLVFVIRGKEQSHQGVAKGATWNGPRSKYGS